MYDVCALIVSANRFLLFVWNTVILRYQGVVLHHCCDKIVDCSSLAMIVGQTMGFQSSLCNVKHLQPFKGYDTSLLIL